jgi:Rieske Fe-S protein
MSDDTMAPPTTAPQTEPRGELRDRRSVLRCAAMVALAGASAPILAACGGGDDAGSAGTTGTSSAPPTSAPTTAASSAPSSSAPAGGGTVLGPTSDVPVGGGKVFTDAKVVVTQPTAGDFKAFSAVCTHQGCLVETSSEGEIPCPCHASRFSLEDGSPLSGPATAPLAPVEISVDGDTISRA